VGTVARLERSVKDQFARVVLTPSAGVHSNRHVLVLMVDPAQAAAAPPPEEPRREPGKRGARK
jgi:cell shape-determining protein MreC